MLASSFSYEILRMTVGGTVAQVLYSGELYWCLPKVLPSLSWVPMVIIRANYNSLLINFVLPNYLKCETFCCTVLTLSFQWEGQYNAMDWDILWSKIYLLHLPNALLMLVDKPPRMEVAYILLVSILRTPGPFTREKIIKQLFFLHSSEFRTFILK